MFVDDLRERMTDPVILHQNIEKRRDIYMMFYGCLYITKMRWYGCFYAICCNIKTCWSGRADERQIYLCGNIHEAGFIADYRYSFVIIYFEREYNPIVVFADKSGVIMT